MPLCEEEEEKEEEFFWFFSFSVVNSIHLEGIVSFVFAS
jgi:hypothetical protein